MASLSQSQCTYEIYRVQFVQCNVRLQAADRLTPCLTRFIAPGVDPEDIWSGKVAGRAILKERVIREGRKGQKGLKTSEDIIITIEKQAGRVLHCEDCPPSLPPSSRLGAVSFDLNDHRQDKDVLATGA